MEGFPYSKQERQFLHPRTLHLRLNIEAKFLNLERAAGQLGKGVRRSALPLGRKETQS